jgi:hypothetical protein
MSIFQRRMRHKMPRPRQKSDNDCAVVVFREITGEDEETASTRFSPYLQEYGTPVHALSSCLTDAGWMLTDYEYAAMQAVGREGLFDDEAFRKFWTQFEGIAVMGYTKTGAANNHAILIRSGGIVFDPSPTAPEDGEFIAEHFKRACGRIIITSVSTVTRMLSAECGDGESTK